jgi:hypothetical protein
MSSNPNPHNRKKGKLVLFPLPKNDTNNEPDPPIPAASALTPKILPFRAPAARRKLPLPKAA